jgi:hypothetical protein
MPNHDIPSNIGLIPFELIWYPVPSFVLIRILPSYVHLVLVVWCYSEGTHFKLSTFPESAPRLVSSHYDESQCDEKVKIVRKLPIRRIPRTEQSNVAKLGPGRGISKGNQKLLIHWNQFPSNRLGRKSDEKDRVSG